MDDKSKNGDQDKVKILANGNKLASPFGNLEKNNSDTETKEQFKERTKDQAMFLIGRTLSGRSLVSSQSGNYEIAQAIKAAESEWLNAGTGA